MIFLRFPDEQAFTDATAAHRDEDGNLTISLDVIGTIYEGGEYDNEGNVIEPPTQIPGWHVNMLGDVPAGFAPYVIKRPNSPHRIFAGHN